MEISLPQETKHLVFVYGTLKRNEPNHKLYFLCIYFTQSDVRWQDTSSQLLLSAFCSGSKLSSLQDIHFITKILLSSNKYYKYFQRA